MLRQNSLKRADIDRMNIKAETNEYYGGTHRSYLRVRKIQQLFDCSTALLLSLWVHSILASIVV